MRKDDAALQLRGQAIQVFVVPGCSAAHTAQRMRGISAGLAQCSTLTKPHRAPSCIQIPHPPGVMLVKVQGVWSLAAEALAEGGGNQPMPKPSPLRLP